MTTLRQEFEYFLANKGDLIEKYGGKFIVLKDNEIIGVFEDRLVAIKKTKETHPLGTFLVQHVSSSDEQAHFHSRVAL